MCVPGCMEKISKSLTRRSFISSLIATSAYAASSCTTKNIPLSTNSSETNKEQITFSKVIDLTHTLSSDFPTFFGKPLFKVKKNTTFKKDHFNTNYIEMLEHVGTHIDAPIHFSENGKTVDQIPVSDLVLPINVIDIRSKADSNPDYSVTLEDIKNFELTNGQIQARSCVAMLSGWDKRADSKEFRNVDSKNQMHFPGFSLEAVKFLAIERNVNCIGVDTLSLDTGISKDFSVHYFWLPSGRFGIECLANLDKIPVTGANLVVGAPKFKDCTGGPSRVMALV